MKNLFKSFDSCIDNIPITLLSGQTVAAYLKSCPYCNKTTELGMDAKMKDRKFGNFYSVRESFKVHKRTNESSVAYKLLQMGKGRMKFRKDDIGFRFYEVDRKFSLAMTVIAVSGVSKHILFGPTSSTGWADKEDEVWEGDICVHDYLLERILSLRF